MNLARRITLLLLLFVLKSYVMTSEVEESRIFFGENKFNLDSEVQFYLYTRGNDDSPDQLWLNNTESITQSSYNHSQPTAFMVHGWQSNYTKGYNGLIRKAYLDHGDYNVIIVDWSKIANLSYLESLAQIQPVGKHIAKLVDFLTNSGSNPDDITLVGFSLGAHVVGIAGYNANNKIGHVVGLDPAGPLFSLATPGKSISKYDAKFVEILHTNIGKYGLARPAGHVDFYANGGGPVQPACENDPSPKDCSHNRAYLLFVEAFTRPDQLVVVKCSDYEEFLAGQCNKNNIVSLPNWSTKEKEHGLYYLRTNATSPYGMGLEGTQPVNSTTGGY